MSINRMTQEDAHKLVRLYKSPEYLCLSELLKPWFDQALTERIEKSDSEMAAGKLQTERFLDQLFKAAFALTDGEADREYRHDGVFPV